MSYMESPWDGKEWLVLCHEHGDGAVCLWWRANGAGYTRLIDEAGRYTETEARAIENNRQKDVAVRLADAEAAAQRVVMLDRLPGAKSAWRRRHDAAPQEKAS